jgi:hypothetical protein
MVGGFDGWSSVVTEDAPLATSGLPWDRGAIQSRASILEYPSDDHRPLPL